MNGMAASDKIFAFLKTDTEKNCGTQNIEGSVDITIRNLGFAYDKDRKFWMVFLWIFIRGSSFL